MATSLTFTGALFTSASILATGSATTPLTIAQGGPNGSRIYGISGHTNSTTATAYFQLIYSSSAAGGTGITLGTVPVLAQAGNTTVAASDIFGQSVVASVFQKQKDANGVPYFNMAPSSIMQIRQSGSAAQQSTGTNLNITTFGEFY